MKEYFLGELILFFAFCGMVFLYEWGIRKPFPVNKVGRLALTIGLFIALYFIGAMVLFG